MLCVACCPLRVTCCSLRGDCGLPFVVRLSIVVHGALLAVCCLMVEVCGLWCVLVVRCLCSLCGVYVYCVVFVVDCGLLFVVCLFFVAACWLLFVVRCPLVVVRCGSLFGVCCCLLFVVCCVFL